MHIPPPAYAVVLSSRTTCAICLWVRVPKKMVGGRGGFSFRRLPDADATAAVPDAASTKSVGSLPLLLPLLLLLPRRCFPFNFIAAPDGAAEEMLLLVLLLLLLLPLPLLLLLLLDRILRFVGLFLTT